MRLSSATPTAEFFSNFAERFVFEQLHILDLFFSGAQDNHCTGGKPVS